MTFWVGVGPRENARCHTYERKRVCRNSAATSVFVFPTARLAPRSSHAMSHPSPVVSLASDLRDVVAVSAVSPSALRQRAAIAWTLRDVLERLLNASSPPPGRAAIECYGSTIMGVGLDSSDLDIAVHFSSHSDAAQQGWSIHAATAFCQCDAVLTQNEFEIMRVTPAFRLVQVVTVRHRASGVLCDVSFGQSSAVLFTTHFLKTFFDEQPVAAMLAVVVKAAVRDLSLSREVVSSQVVTLTVTAFYRAAMTAVAASTFGADSLAWLLLGYLGCFSAGGTFAPQHVAVVADHPAGFVLRQTTSSQEAKGFLTPLQWLVVDPGTKENVALKCCRIHEYRDALRRLWDRLVAAYPGTVDSANTGGGIRHVYRPRLAPHAMELVLPQFLSTKMGSLGQQPVPSRNPSSITPENVPQPAVLPTSPPRRRHNQRLGESAFCLSPSAPRRSSGRLSRAEEAALVGGAMQEFFCASSRLLVTSPPEDDGLPRRPSCGHQPVCATPAHGIQSPRG